MSYINFFFFGCAVARCVNFDFKVNRNYSFLTNNFLITLFDSCRFRTNKSIIKLMQSVLLIR